MTQVNKQFCGSEVLPGDTARPVLFTDTREVLIDGSEYEVTIAFSDVDGRPEVGSVTIATSGRAHVSATALRKFALTRHIDAVLNERAELWRDLQGQGRPAELGPAFDRAVNERDAQIAANIRHTARGTSSAKKKGRPRDPYLYDHWQAVADAYSNAPDPGKPIPHVRRVMEERLGELVTLDQAKKWVWRARHEFELIPLTKRGRPSTPIRSVQVKDQEATR